MMNANERRAHAVRAAVAVASRLGVVARAPSVLADSNQTVIHLTPSLVAKVWTAPIDGEAAGREMGVARHLAKRGIPVVSPASSIPPGPHWEDGLAVCFWEYAPPVDGEIDGREVGALLSRLHAGLADYAGPLPAFSGDLRAIAGELESPYALRALPEADRAMVRERFDAAMEALPPAFTMRPIHGDPHLGNLLLSAAGPLWLDFESACLGPVEWDLGALPDEAVWAYSGPIDHALLSSLRVVRSAGIIAWCWLDPNRDPALRRAGDHDLTRLRAMRGAGDTRPSGRE